MEDSPVSTFSLDDFEQSVYTRQYVKASIQFTAALALLQKKRGKLDESFLASGMTGLAYEEQYQRFCTRLASAASTLFADPRFELPPGCLELLLTLHEWIGLVFCHSAFGNADHVARHLNPRGPHDSQFLAGDRFVEKLCVLYSTDSELELDFAALWTYDRKLAASLALALLSPAFKGSANAHLKREALLEWLPGKLQLIDDLDDLPTALLHNAYMFCSYADTPRRHEIKRDINVLVRRKLASLGLRDLRVHRLEPRAAASRAQVGKPRGKKPLMIVLLEWFGGAHSIYRTHSRTLEAAREHFELVGFGFDHAVDDDGRAVFDRFIELDKSEYVGECLQTIRDFADAERPDVLYMPSVGMFVATIFMSNLRVAPLQIAGLGHPATTHSDKIDFVSVEEDYAGDPACFSERLLKLPRDGQPYRPSVALPDLVASIAPPRERVEVVITASAMKINPGFLGACREIAARAVAPVEFHFMSGVQRGIQLEQMRDAIGAAVPGAIVHGFHHYPDYLTRVKRADLFLSPFPFGNTNGIVDALTMGLPGVCKRGPEVFERIDGALFERVGMPSWAIGESVENYVAAAVRMIDAHAERVDLRRRLIDTRAVQRCFEGRPEVFGEAVLGLVRGEGVRRGAGLRASGFGLRASRFGLRASGFRAFGLRAFGLRAFGLRASGFGLSGFGLRASGFGLSGFGLSGFRASGLRGFGASGLRGFGASGLRGFGFRARGFWLLAFGSGVDFSSGFSSGERLPPEAAARFALSLPDLFAHIRAAARTAAPAYSTTEFGGRYEDKLQFVGPAPFTSRGNSAPVIRLLR